MLRVLVVEDEQNAAGALRDCIMRFSREDDIDIDIVWERDALGLMKVASPIDLIFLDIGLPLTNGLEAAGLLRTYDTQTPIIFITSNAQYALRGYEVDALDFIVKPVRYGDFKMRMRKALRVVQRNANETVAVGTSRETHVLPISDISHITTSGHNAVIHLSSQDDTVVDHESLAKLSSRLPSGRFVRISSGCLVNMAYIRTVQSSAIRLTSGETLPVSRGKRKPALEEIARYLGRSV